MSDPTDPSDIEFLDSTAGGAPITQADVATTSPRRSLGLGIAALVVAGAGLAALAADDGAISPTSTAPPTTADQATTTTRGLNSTITVPGSTAMIGEGPDLAWQRVGGPSPGSTDFEWIDGAFVSSDGRTDWLIGPTENGFETTERPSALVDPAGRTSIDAVGALAWLTPEGFADVANGLEVLTIELDPIARPDTELGAIVVDHRVAANGQRILVLRTTGFAPDGAGLLARLGEPSSAVGEIYDINVSDGLLTIYGTNGEVRSPLTATDFTEQEIGWLRLTGQPQMVAEVFDQAGEIITSTPVGDGPALSVAVVDATFAISTIREVFRSLDGQSWGASAIPPAVQISSGTSGVNGGLYGNDYNSFSPRFTRSQDLGITWMDTPQPVASPVFQNGLGPLVVSLGWSEQSSNPTRFGATENGFTLKLTDNFDRYELSSPNGATLASGAVVDPESGFDIGPGTLSYRFIDPDTDIELVHFDQLDLLRGFAAIVSNAGEPMLMATANWVDSDVDPIWTLETVAEAFGSGALSASFVTGEDLILATVETNAGRKYFVAQLS